MAEFQQGRQVVVDRLKRRISQYRTEHNTIAAHIEATFPAVYDTEHKRTLALKQRHIESKTKKNSTKKEKKLDQPQANMGQSKMLARGHEATNDDPPENPAKKPRLTGPAHIINTTSTSGSSSLNSNVATFVSNNTASSSTGNNSSNGPNVDITEFQIVQQLHALKRSDSPLAQVPAVNSVDSSFPGNLLPSNFFEDVKKEEFDIEDLESFEDAFRDIDFDLIQSEDLDMSDVRPENSNASGFSLGNDCDPFSLVLENGEATSVSSDGGTVGVLTNSSTSPSMLQQLSQQQQEPTTTIRMPQSQTMTATSNPPSSVPSPASFQQGYSNPQALSQASQFPTSSTVQTSTSSPGPFQNTPSSMSKVHVGGIPTVMPGLPPQAGDSPAATTLKNMAQVHQKQQIGPVVGPGRAQGFNDFVPFSVTNSQAIRQNVPNHPMYAQGMNSNMNSMYNTQNPSSMNEMDLKKRQMLHQQQQMQIQLNNSGMQMQQPQHGQANMHPQQAISISTASSMPHHLQQQQQQQSALSIPSSQSSQMSNIGGSNSSVMVTQTTTPHTLPKAPTPSHMLQGQMNPQIVPHQQLPQQQTGLQPQLGNGTQANGPQQNQAHAQSNVGPVTNTNGMVNVSSGDMNSMQQHHQMPHMQQMMSMQQSAAGGPAAMMGGMQGGFSRMSPMASYGGQPGAGAMGQYGAMPMRGPSGVRPAYHRPSSLSPGAQMVPSMSADGKMSQEMYYPAQFSGMGQSQPPRYPNQMMGPSMMRAMTPGQHSLMMSQNGQMMTRPPPPEYRHATNIMQQQQQQMMAQPMPQAMGPGMGQMVYGNMRPGLRPGMAGGNMVNLGNGTPTGAVPSSMLGAGGPTSNASGMVQQQQSLPPSLPSMKPGGAVGTVSSTAPSTSLATSLAMTSMCPASSMACTMTSAGGMSAVHSNVGGQCSVASRAAMMQQHQRSCPPNVNVGPGGLVPQMQSGRPEWSNMMMQRGQTGMMMRPSGYPSHPHHQQQQAGMMGQNSQMMGMARNPSQMMPMMAGPGMSANMQGNMAAMQPGMGGPMAPGMAGPMQPGMAGPMQPGMASGMQGPGMNPTSRIAGMPGALAPGQVRMGLQMSQSGGMGGAQVTSQYPAPGTPMGSMAQMPLQGASGSMVPPGQMQGASGPHMMGAGPGRNSGVVGGIPSARSPAGMVQMNGGQSHPMSPANMGNMGGSSPASMAGMGSQAHSPASMGGMSHPRSPAAMMQHPRSPATMGGPGRPLSNPSMGYSAPGGTTPNMMNDLVPTTIGSSRSNPATSMAGVPNNNSLNKSSTPTPCASLASNNNNNNASNGQQQQRPPSTGRISQPLTPNPPSCNSNSTSTTTANSSSHTNTANANANKNNPSNPQQQIEHLDINSFFNAPQDFASLLEEHN